MEIIIYLIIGYLILMQLVGAFITVKDKASATSNKWRTKESTLLLISALGGSIGMLLTMKKIRHKTQKNKFMIGIPAIIIVQIVLIVVISLFLLDII